MEQVTNTRENWNRVIKYGVISFLAMVVDTLAVFILVNRLVFPIVHANTVGIFLGFMIHYCLATKAVFNIQLNRTVFLIYLVTFLFGLALANLIIWFFFDYLHLGFGLSKMASIILPFTGIFWLRKFLFEKFQSERQQI